MLLIQGPHFNKKSLSSSVTKHFTYTSKSIQLNSVHLQGTPLSDSENPAYLGLIICWPGVKQSSTMKLIFRFSFFPFIFHFFLFVLMKSGEQFKKKKKSLRRSLLKFCLEVQMFTQQQGLLRAGSVLGRDWWALTSAPWRADSMLYTVIEQELCNCSNHSQWKGGRIKDTQQFLKCNTFINPTGQTFWNLLIVQVPQKLDGLTFDLLLVSCWSIECENNHM